MKKSQISIQFHWIFILVAGIIILGFFIGIALRQKTVSEKRLAIDVKEKFNEIFAGAGASESTAIEIFVPDIEIEFSCIGNVSRYVLKNGDVSQDTVHEIIFASDLVKSKSTIITWAIPWNMPFNVQNFLMIASPEIRYIFVYGDGGQGIAMNLMNATPDKLTKEMYHVRDIEDIIYKKNSRVRFVFLQMRPQMPSDFEDVKDEVVSAVEIQPNRYVQFYKKEDNGGFEMKSYPEDSFDIIEGDKVMVYAAIFSGDIEMYRCNMAKAYSRLRYVAGIYKERVQMLKQEHVEIEGEYPVCSFYYTPDGFDELIAGAKNMNRNMILSGASKIRETNERLENTGACPVIY